MDSLSIYIPMNVSQKRDSRVLSCLFFLFSSLSFSAYAYDVGSRILATGGATQVEGSGGTGIVPWAVISGYGQNDEWGGTVFATHVVTDDYDFSAAGISVGINNRVEFSLATEILDISALNNSIDDELKQVVAGVKVRLFGDLIYGNYPQVSVGAQYKKNTDFDIPGAVGAVDDEGVDYYIAASRLWLTGIKGYPILTNVTFRSTKANQLGLLGFGGNLRDRHEILFEGSAAILLRRNLLFGIDYRQKPNNLAFAEESDWFDIFLAWFPSKHFSIVGAYANLGDIAGLPDQDGFYISLEGSY